MGKPGYEITAGSVLLDGVDLLVLEPHERAHAGLFLAMQYPTEVPGVSIEEMLTEALVATAYAHVHTGEPWCLEWHERIREWAFAHYPVPTGEWRQWLDREGQPTTSAALPVKDPFHLPRALIWLLDLCGR